MASIASDATTTRGHNGLGVRLAAIRTAFETYRRKRSVYLRTLRELQSYRPRELNDLRIDPADFEAVARKAAGW